MLFSKFDVFVANDLDTLLPNFLVSKMTKSPLYYNSHEYFTEVPELVDRPKVRKVWEKLERGLLPKVRNAYTVCQSIAEAYRYKYGTYFQVVRNVPERMSPFEIREDKKLGLGDKKVILYQGALNVGRGLEPMIRAMQEIDHAVLVIVGDGDIAAHLQALVLRLSLQDKVKFLGRIPFNEVKHITVQADLGLSIEEDLGLNYRFALPNKLFDYIQAQVPVLITNLPEMAALMNRYEIGEITPSLEPEILGRKINEMLSDETKRSVWKKNLETAARELTWENEEKILQELFSNFI